MVPPERVAARVALFSVGTSALLATLKITVGIAAHSVSVVSDGFESVADFVSSGLVLVGLMIAAKPADEDHPYGHGRFETLIGLAIGTLLAVVGAAICIGAIEQKDDRQIPHAFALWALGVSLAIKSFLAIAKFRTGKQTRSSALTADAWNDIVDLISGSVAVISVSLSILLPGTMRAADHYGGFVIGLIVIFVGVRVIRETTLHLMDTMPGEDQMEQLRAVALHVPGALAVEKCYARKTGLRYHVDLHLEVDPQLTVLASHEIARAVKRSLKAHIEWVEDVLIHVEPHRAASETAQSEVTIKPTR